jgi:tetratricopeptide (TPR) repeat protein
MLLKRDTALSPETRKNSVRERSAHVSKFYRLYEADELKAAHKLAAEDVRKWPNDHDTYFRLAFANHAMRRFKQAMIATKRGLNITPECPMLMAMLAEHIGAMKRHREAIKVCRSLLRKKPASLQKAECSEGADWARNILNDCRIHLVRLYSFIGNRSEALKHFSKALRQHNPKLTCYSPIVLKRIAKELGIAIAGTCKAGFRIKK